jgi:hypothetical protein
MKFPNRNQFSIRKLFLTAYPALIKKDLDKKFSKLTNLMLGILFILSLVFIIYQHLKFKEIKHAHLQMMHRMEQIDSSFHSVHAKEMIFVDSTERKTLNNSLKKAKETEGRTNNWFFWVPMLFTFLLILLGIVFHVKKNRKVRNIFVVSSVVTSLFSSVATYEIKKKLFDSLLNIDKIEFVYKNIKYQDSTLIKPIEEKKYIYDEVYIKSFRKGRDMLVEPHNLDTLKEMINVKNKHYEEVHIIGMTDQDKILSSSIFESNFYLGNARCNVIEDYLRDSTNLLNDYYVPITREVRGPKEYTLKKDSLVQANCRGVKVIFRYLNLNKN